MAVYATDYAVHATDSAVSCRPSAPPPPSCPMAMFQVTFLKCGGVVLGTGIHQVVIDGLAEFQFIQACGGQLPFHDRTLLHARPATTLSTLRPSSAAAARARGPSSPASTQSPPSSSPISSHAAAGPIPTCPRTVPSPRTCGGRMARGSDTRLMVPANVRNRVSPPLPRSFFGNAVVRSLVTARVSDVILDDGRSLGFVSATVEEAVNGVDDAFVRSAVDYLELVECTDALQAATGNEAEQGVSVTAACDLWSVSWLGMFVAPADMIAGGAAYITPRSNRNDGIDIFVALEAECMESFKKSFYGE
ncbi:hypothetical protein U9M48_025404 [Paspalum notatum var. saurae]|uniref:Uncharacterized protein n=1 Tax=Paspalum notatum var. saurae TaxID=547442 RepID=A0AAQ3WX26_PASNO